MPMNRDVVLILAASTLRSVAIGGLGVYFGLYLASLGFTEFQIGVVIAAGLAGMATGTLIVGLNADRFGRRKSFLLIVLLMAAGGIALSSVQGFVPVILASLVGMVNGMGRDRGPAQAIDQAVLAQSVDSTRRTATFSMYTFLLDIGTASGAVMAGFLDSEDAYRNGLLVYAGLVILSATAYPYVSKSVEATAPESATSLSPESRKLIKGFAWLSVLDSLGGGFITRSLLTYWFIKRFDADPAWMGILFGSASLINSVSYFVAARLAKKIGLVNTMVFTHIPSSILLMLVPFAPSFAAAAALYFVREFFAPMDVPTRQSYLSAIVRDHERTAAAGIVNLARNASWVAGPTLAGWVMGFSISAPLFAAGFLKIVYDLSLWRSFRHVKPPEELSNAPGKS